MMDVAVQSESHPTALKDAILEPVEIGSSQDLFTKLSTLPEHLCFLIDIDEENAQPWTSDLPNTRMSVIKDALVNFVRRKSNPGLLKHKYAIAVFSSGRDIVHLVLPFTTSAEEFKTAVDALEPEINENHGREGKTIHINDILTQLGTLLGLDNHRSVRSTTMLPSHDDYSSMFQHSSHKQHTVSGADRHAASQPPDSHLTRCVLVYGRSREVPVVEQSTPYIPLLHSPQCCVDILYVHLRGNEENVRCQDIFDALCRIHPFAAAWIETTSNHSGKALDQQPLPLNPSLLPLPYHLRSGLAGALVLETHGSSIKLASHIALLLAHPAQRPTQEQVHPTTPCSCRYQLPPITMESLLDMSRERHAHIKLSMGRDDAHVHMDNIDSAEPLPAPAPATTANS